MKSISVTNFKAHCLGLLNEVATTGQPIILTKRGKATAMVSRPPSEDESPRWIPGRFIHTAKIVGDIVAPLDEPWESLD